MGASFSCCSGANFSFSGMFRGCISKKKNKKNNLEYNRIIQDKEDNFKITKLKKINGNEIFSNPEEICLIIIINNKNKLVSITRNSYENNFEIILDNEKNIDYLNKFLPVRFVNLIKQIHKKTLEKNNEPVGVLTHYENFDYSLIGLPIYNNNFHISTIILKKIYFQDIDNLSINSL